MLSPNWPLEDFSWDQFDATVFLIVEACSLLLPFTVSWLGSVGLGCLRPPLFLGYSYSSTGYTRSKDAVLEALLA